MERGTRQTSPPCPDLLQTGRATGGAGLNVRLDSLEEVDDRARFNTPHLKLVGSRSISCGMRMVGGSMVGGLHGHTHGSSA